MTLIRFLFGTCLYLLSCQLVFQYFNEHNRSISETGCKDRTFFPNSKLLQIFFSFFNKKSSELVFLQPQTATKLIMNQYLQILWTFSKIGAFTLGGGYAMIPLIQKEVVEKKKWISEDEFADLIALAQSAPGLLAVNTSIFLGNKLKGIKGAIVATIGSTFPSFAIILAIAMVFKGYQDNETVIAVFKGIRPAVVALIAVPMINMARKSNKNIVSWGITAVSLGLVGFLKVSPIYIIIVSLIGGYIYIKSRESHGKEAGK